MNKNKIKQENIHFAINRAFVLISPTIGEGGHIFGLYFETYYNLV